MTQRDEPTHQLNLSTCERDALRDLLNATFDNPRMPIPDALAGIIDDLNTNNLIELDT